MATIDVRKALPLGVNDVDMKENGQRSGPMDSYGHPHEQRTVYTIFKAWDVKKWWLVNHTGLLTNDGIPTITRAGGPVYMLLFGDGKWRYAKFGGLNGPPWSYCPWEGWEAPNGQSAYLQMCLEGAIKRRTNLEAEVAATANEIAEIKQQLSEALKKPQRSDGVWTGKS